MSVGGTLVTAFLVTLARPSTWLLALAAFLVRGGILLLSLPIIILPTPVGIANLVGPTLVGFVFGGISTGFVLLGVAMTAAILAWILFGGAVAAAVETELARVVAVDDEVTTAAGEGSVPVRSGTAGRVLAARLFTMAPLLLALLWGAAIIVGVAYAELTLPSDTSRPILWRVVAGAPETILLLVAAWALSEILAARAARLITLDGASLPGAIGGAIVGLIRRPIASVVAFVVPTLVLVIVLVPVAAATGTAWEALRTELQRGHSLFQFALVLAGFVGLWFGGLVLTAMVCAWRQAVWTVDAVRQRGGTFRAPSAPRPEGWNHDVPSVTL